MVVRIRRGLDLRFEGAPRQSIEDGPAIETVALLGADYPGLRFDLLVDQGDEVAAGQALMRQRTFHDRVVVAPVSGRIDAVTRGARRSLTALEIAPDGEDAIRFEVPATLDRSSLVALLLQSGSWAGLRARPFGRPADLAVEPEALFVTAMDTRPHAPDPAVVIAAHAEWFRRGAEALLLLTAGRTYVCHAEGASLPLPTEVSPVAFAGRHPAGLASTHIHHLHPVSRSARLVWQIGYQDVIALGHLLTTGTIWQDRIVAVSGASVLSPELLRTRPGVSLRQLVQGRLAGDAVTLRSGSVLDGRVQAYLSRGHLQVFAAPHDAHATEPGWLRHLVHNWMHAGIPAVIPNGLHDRAAPIGVQAIPLLRALSAGDADSARRLGARELVEEDLALLSHVDGTGTDFGAMLRAILDELEGAV